MSTVSTQGTRSLVTRFNERTAEDVERVIESVKNSIAPVWPLRDFVAVNPYGGLADQKFLDARARLQALSDCETLMPVAYYQVRFKAGHFGLGELGQAIDEMVEDRIPGAESLNANAIFKLLECEQSQGAKRSEAAERLRLTSELYDRFTGANWTTTIQEEISKYCSAHYDEGQATWESPYKHLPLYQAWRSIAQHDRNIEFLGLSGFRDFVAELPHTPTAAIFVLLTQADVPQHLWADYLLCVALSLPGWSAWTKYKTEESRKKGFENPDFTALLAIRLAYDVAVSEQFDFAADRSTASFSKPENSDFWGEALLGLTLLRANEIGFRERVLEGIHSGFNSGDQDSGPVSEGVNGSNLPTRKLAQMVFCIDVRSERIRRNIERTSKQIETFGFAGFFGLPFEFVRIGDEEGTSQLPVLLEPKFRVYEEVRSYCEISHSQSTKGLRSRIRTMRHLWKSFQTSAVSCFAFVETNGLLYIKNFVDRMRRRATKSPQRDGMDADVLDKGPAFDRLKEQGITESEQIELAESILRGVGITKDFAKLVVLCGHGSSTENNPLQAGLDCGACGGHSGEANARFAAMLLNRQYVRSGLAERGIEIPENTHFLAGLHNTTTDEITFFDLEFVPEASQGFITELKANTSAASEKNRSERLKVLPGSDGKSLIQRSLDWSEVRPEWGLTGNAAFVIGPRELTKSFSLQGEAFLHSYDYQGDDEGALLEQIMTAPLVVANWINMQYFASTVDQKHFGSGTKTIHNVVGKFGILSGNGGDLTTGLPWESVHNGEQYQHDPMRLLTVIEAPRKWIEQILSAHQNVRELVVNGWLNLVVIDDQEFYRFTENSEWQQLQVGLPAKGLHSA